jgi:hypothetical protein
MKLSNVVAANMVWRKILQLRVKPAMAYTLLKYSRLIEAEFAIVETTRVALIHELTNTKEGEEVTLQPGTDAYKAYVDRFSAILDVDSELKPSELKFDTLLSALADDQTNILSATDLGVLEPFFTV